MTRAHADHPLRHFDRTCEACSELSIIKLRLERLRIIVREQSCDERLLRYPSPVTLEDALRRLHQEIER